MEDYSELHYVGSMQLVPKIIQNPDKEGNKEPMTLEELLSAAPKKIPKMSLEQLLSSVPYSMRKPAHKELAAQFPPEPEFIGEEEEEEEPRQIRYRNLPPIDFLEDLDPVMYPPPQNPANEEEVEEEEEEEGEEPRQIFDGDLQPIDLEDMEPVAVASPMWPRPQNPANEEEEEEEEEEPRQILAPIDLEDLEPMVVASPMYPPPQSPQYFDFEDAVLENGPVHDFEDAALEHEPADDPFEDRPRSKDQIRKDLLVECKNEYPSSFRLDSNMKVGKTTTREAAGTFYAAIVLLKNQAIKAKQEAPFGPIELTFTGNCSDDLEEMAKDVEEENGLDVANELEEMEVDNENI